MKINNFINDLPEKFKQISINNFFETNNEDWFDYEEKSDGTIKIIGIKDEHKIINKDNLISYNTNIYDILIWVDTSPSMERIMDNVKTSIKSILKTLLGFNTKNKISFIIPMTNSFKTHIENQGHINLNNSNENYYQWHDDVFVSNATNNLNDLMEIIKFIEVPPNDSSYGRPESPQQRNGQQNIHNVIIFEDPTILVDILKDNSSFNKSDIVRSNDISKKLIIFLTNETAIDKEQETGRSNPGPYWHLFNIGNEWPENNQSGKYLQSTFIETLKKYDPQLFYIFSKDENQQRYKEEITYYNKIINLFKSINEKSNGRICYPSAVGDNIIDIFKIEMSNGYRYFYASTMPDPEDSSKSIQKYKDYIEGDPNPPPELFLEIPYKIGDKYVTEISDGAFKGNIAIRTFITQPLLKTIGDDIFDETDADLKLIEFMDYHINDVNNQPSIDQNSVQIKYLKDNKLLLIKGLYDVTRSTPNNHIAYFNETPDTDLIIDSDTTFYPIYSNCYNSLWPTAKNEFTINSKTGEAFNYEPIWSAPVTIIIDCTKVPCRRTSKIVKFRFTIPPGIKSVSDILNTTCIYSNPSQSIGDTIKMYDIQPVTALYCKEEKRTYNLNDTIDINQNLTFYPIYGSYSIEIPKEKRLFDNILNEQGSTNIHNLIERRDLNNGYSYPLREFNLLAGSDLTKLTNTGFDSLKFKLNIISDLGNTFKNATTFLKYYDGTSISAKICCYLAISEPYIESIPTKCEVSIIDDNGNLSLKTMIEKNNDYYNHWTGSNHSYVEWTYGNFYAPNQGNKIDPSEIIKLPIDKSGNIESTYKVSWENHSLNIDSDIRNFSTGAEIKELILPEISSIK